MKYVLDASAALAWLRAEPGADRVATVLRSTTDLAVIHALNMLEVRYFLLRRGAEPLQRGVQRMQDAGVAVEMTFSEPLLAIASSLKANRTPISLADAIAVGFAITEGATLLTTDRGEMEKLSDVCSIEFLR